MGNKYKEFEAIKSKLTKSLKDALYKDAAAPEGERPVNFDVTVPYGHVVLDDDDQDYAQALVIYSVMCPNEKKHIVRIKFQYDKSGKFLKDTMTYV